MKLNVEARIIVHLELTEPFDEDDVREYERLEGEARKEWLTKFARHVVLDDLTTSGDVDVNELDWLVQEDD